MEKQIKVMSKPAQPDTKSWYEHTWKEHQQTPNRLEDAAKFLASMISVSLTIFLSIGKSSFESQRVPGAILWALALWLLSLFCSFLVLFPWRYRFVSESLVSIKKMHHRVVRVKRIFLLVSLLFFLIALTILVFLFFFT